MVLSFGTALAVTTACIIVLVAVLLALVRPRTAALAAGYALAAGCALAAGSALAAGCALAATAPRNIHGGRAKAAPRRRAPRRAAKNRPYGGEPPHLGGVFARLRASPAGEAATRTQEFFRQLNFEEGFRIAMNGPLGAASGATLPGDEATLAALHEAWERHPWKQGSNPGAQAQERLAELAEHLPPRDRAAEAEPLRYLDISACLGTGADETVAAIASDLGVPPGRTAAADLYASHIAAAADSCEASPKAAPEASDDASERVRVAGGDLPFRDGEFGVVTMLMAAHHFADAPHVFAEVHRVTQPGARLILREHGRADAVAALYYDVLDGFAEVTTGKRSPREWVARYERDRTRYRTPTEWAALAAEAGFTLDAERALRADPFDAVLLAFIRK